MFRNRSVHKRCQHSTKWTKQKSGSLFRLNATISKPIAVAINEHTYVYEFSVFVLVLFFFPVCLGSLSIPFSLFLRGLIAFAQHTCCCYYFSSRLQCEFGSKYAIDFFRSILNVWKDIGRGSEMEKNVRNNSYTKQREKAFWTSFLRHLFVESHQTCRKDLKMGLSFGKKPFRLWRIGNENQRKNLFHWFSTRARNICLQKLIAYQYKEWININYKECERKRKPDSAFLCKLLREGCERGIDLWLWIKIPTVLSLKTNNSHIKPKFNVQIEPI